MEKLLFFTILFISFFSNSALADSKLCSLNGQWFERGIGMAFKLKQEDSKISMYDEIPHPTCGTFLIDGTNDGHNFNFKFYMSNTKEEACQSVIELSGKFISPDCARIGGDMVMRWKIDGKDYQVDRPFLWYREIIKIIDPKPNIDLIITAEPKMPEFMATAAVDAPNPFDYLIRNGIKINYNEPPFTWNLKIKHSPIPGRLDFVATMDEEATNEPMFIPHFNLLKTIDKEDKDKNKLINIDLMGGELTLSVDYYKAMHDEKTYTIKGTNPGQAAIEQILTNTLTRQIACQESRYRQFDAEREGGIGFPMIGKDENLEPIGGAGIMQLFSPEPTVIQTWNWRENLKEGISRLDAHYQLAEIAHIHERNRINDEREEKGLPVCPPGIPTKLSPDQILRETIRRYNCGAEYRWEPRYAPNCEGNWVSDPSCIRRKKKGARANYVNEVLACNINK